MTQDIRPAIDRRTVRQIFRRCTGWVPEEVRQLGTGQIAATFSCTAKGESFVVQFAAPSMGVGVDVERRFRRGLHDVGVPLRHLVGEGLDQGLRWTIARKAAGETMSSLPTDAYERCLTSVFDTLLALASVDVSDTRGFGWIDENGRGRWDSWLEHLRFVRREEPEEMFYGKWHELFETTFLGRTVFERCYEKMVELIEGLEVPRALVHGGFGYGNVLIDGVKVSAVLDWQDARFGDPLFDLAYLDFWPSGFDLAARFETHCRERGTAQPDYRRRVMSYKYNIGLDAMRFFAVTDNRAGYDGAVRILSGLAY